MNTQHMNTMQPLNREQLFAQFRESAHDSIAQALDRDNVPGLAVYADSTGKVKAVPADRLDMPPRDGLTLVGVYLKTPPAAQSRTAAALEWLDAHPNESPYTAGKRFGITHVAIYRAMKRRATRAARKTCPCCGQPMPPETDA